MFEAIRSITQSGQDGAVTWGRHTRLSSLGATGQREVVTGDIVQDGSQQRNYGAKEVQVRMSPASRDQDRGDYVTDK